MQSLVTEVPALHVVQRDKKAWLWEWCVSLVYRFRGQSPWQMWMPDSQCWEKQRGLIFRPTGEPEWCQELWHQLLWLHDYIIYMNAIRFQLMLWLRTPISLALEVSSVNGSLFQSYKSYFVVHRRAYPGEFESRETEWMWLLPNFLLVDCSSTEKFWAFI